MRGAVVRVWNVAGSRTTFGAESAAAKAQRAESSREGGSFNPWMGSRGSEACRRAPAAAVRCPAAPCAPGRAEGLWSWSWQEGQQLLGGSECLYSSDRSTCVVEGGRGVQRTTLPAGSEHQACGKELSSAPGRGGSPPLPDLQTVRGAGTAGFDRAERGAGLQH